VVLRRRDLAASTPAAAPGGSLPARLQALRRTVVAFPELLVPQVPPKHPDGLEPAVRAALQRRFRAG
jgi:hypothetical protein